MSSPKTAAAKSVRRPQVRSAAKRVPPAVKRSESQRAAKPAGEPANGGTGSAQATRLAAANLAVFELGMWQSWTGR
jgi:hypothetical protein